MLAKGHVVGILAHVDSGKTTLAESMMYNAGAIRRLGRVDHQDSFLDNNGMERKRGITIFSKQACFTWNFQNISLPKARDRLCSSLFINPKVYLK